MTTNIMIDLETEDTLPSAVILSIGIVPFNPITGEVGEGAALNIPMNRAEQEAKGRTSSQQTLAWWDRQSPEARASWDVPALDLWEPLDAMREVCKYFSTGVYVWSHGSIFDVAILEDLFRSYRVPIPWKYWAIRDTRTIYHLAGVKPDRAEGVHHNAMVDAIQQAKAVCEAYKKLGITNDEGTEKQQTSLPDNQGQDRLR